MMRYTQAVFNQLAQQVACNSTHTVEPRAARWLLMTLDRAGTSEFQLTHEFLAQMLAVRRASVSVILRNFQQAGYLEYQRGTVQILNRSGLEKISCEHYRLINQEYDRLLPVSS